MRPFRSKAAVDRVVELTPTKADALGDALKKVVG